MSRITLVPTFRAGQTPHRLPLSSRDNLALRYEGFFPSSDTADTPLSEALDEHQDFFDADGVKPADADDRVGLFLALVTLGCIIWLAAMALGYVYLLAGGWR